MTVVTRRRRRNSLRLQGYDYSQPGEYFVTFCVQNRVCLLGDIEQARVILNPYGQLVADHWFALPEYYAHVQLDKFVVMPNHVHAIIRLKEIDLPVRATISEIVRTWKGFSTRAINELRRTSTVSIWQRGFWDHIIQNERERFWIQTYISENPLRWTLDQLHPGQPPFL